MTIHGVMRRSFSVVLVSLAVAFTGCGDDAGSSAGAGGSGGTGGAGPNLQELFDQGLTRFVGEFSPENDPTPDENGVRRYDFAVPDDLAAEPRSPLCLRGGQYSIDTRAGSSDELHIFLQGGGACWQDFCAAFEEANNLTIAGLLDPTTDGNPIADADVVYFPYCDGSLFAGDVDRMLPASVAGGMGGSGMSMGYQRGLQNLTAGLDIAAAEFPNPSRIILAGISGGAFGTIVAAPLVRFYYPDVDILVLNDSGIGIAKEGDQEFVDGLLTGWNANGSVPASCVDCTGNGHVTRLIEWNLEADPRLWISAISHAQDSVIAAFFLMITGDAFSASLVAETSRISMNFPDRYKYFIMPGDPHTILLNAGEPSDVGVATLGTLQTEIDGTTALEWISAMLSGGEDWRNLVDPTVGEE